ncbi:hypothetical protein M2350_000100 [Candidatus Fervidibacter sacchari]|uniref:Transcriptional regulator n=1 Tax=Candidatus Fervidibacter sacchari TaxID=1448929 RepID=A0ABT2EIC9_9BACT|nr:hypothetical protein [Candidatus Fervidibacter sacchari]
MKKPKIFDAEVTHSLLLLLKGGSRRYGAN